ncbi:MAG: hypothetical protein DRI37_03785 [Chloroflexi bacterium]|nr:MAG: hypothetical protein DRI37_03785 [Chloroflexota bacterium]
MSTRLKTMTIKLPPEIHPILNSVAGKTPSEKISKLLLNEIRRYLKACEQERLELEIKYGLEYTDFQQKLAAGELGNEFEYDLEMDALRWGDLIVEKKHWLQQLNLLKGQRR